MHICDIETLNQFFIYCPQFVNDEENLVLKIEKTDTSIHQYVFMAVRVFLTEFNVKILNSLFDYILTTTKVESTLFIET